MNQQPAIRQNNAAIFARMGERYGVKGEDLSHILRSTAFKGSVNDEQMAALLIIADQFKLNPFTKEIYAFPAKNGGGIVPVVGVDGWTRIVNEHPQMDGLEFRQSQNILENDQNKKCPEWIECVIYRKDRNHPIVVREYIDECTRNTDPWKSHPKRMLRHKAFIQCARMAFGFSGIYDEDEAQRIAEARVVTAQETMAAPIEVEASQPLALPAAAQFEILLQDMGITGDRRPLVEEYISLCENSFNTDRENVISKFLEREQDFRRTYPQWEKSVMEKQAQTKTKRKPKEKTASAQDAPAAKQPPLQTEEPRQPEVVQYECPREQEGGKHRMVTEAECKVCASKVGCVAYWPPSGSEPANPPAPEEEF